MMKKIGVLIVVLFLAGSVFALQAPRPTTATVSTDAITVGPWQSLWQMHYKWNPTTRHWDKRVFVPTPSRGTYDFKTKKWVK